MFKLIRITFNNSPCIWCLSAKSEEKKQFVSYKNKNSFTVHLALATSIGSNVEIRNWTMENEFLVGNR